VPADVALITSLRDGMNLVSYEYVACQADNAGVLVLSEFAGAAQSLGAGAARGVECKHVFWAGCCRAACLLVLSDVAEAAQLRLVPVPHCSAQQLGQADACCLAGAAAHA
jgi:hypothetical protein